MERGAYDFEADNWTDPICCGLLSGFSGNRQWEFIRDSDKTNVAPRALQAMLASGVKHWYAHNGGKYDTSFFLPAIQFLGWKAEGFGASGRLISLKIIAPNGTFTLHDSYALVQASLKRAAIDFQLQAQKLLTEDDYSRNPSTWGEKRLEEGCRADCECVLELLEKVETLVHSFNGKMCNTFSSTALSILRANHTVLDFRPHSAINKIAREAFTGGRVEVFRHNPDGLLSEWDVASSYPWSMAQELPFEFVRMAHGLSAQKYLFETDTASLIEADVSIPEVEIPVLPWRHPEGGIYFPTGEFRAWFVADELRYAMQTKAARLMRIRNAIVYQRRKPFVSFVEKLYEMKRTSKGAMRAFTKLMLNGCYGKFGQHPEKEVLQIFSDHDEAFEALKIGKTRVLGSALFQLTEKYLWSAQTHYAIAAYITARSRMLLHKFLSIANNLAYCDTDSIHAAKDSPLEMYESDALGGLKREVSEMYAHYYAAKIYELHPISGKPIYASKGFPVSENAFRRVVAKEAVSTERMQLFKRQLLTGNKPSRVKDVKRWSGMSLKRRRIAKGNTVAWSVKELLENEHLKGKE